MKKRQMRKIVVLFLYIASFVFAAAIETEARQQRNVSGKLAPTVEAGGWLIVDAQEKYLLLNAEKFRGESWFREGTQVTAAGEIKRDAVTIYQEGIPFEARTLRPTGNSAAAAGSNNRLTTIIVSGAARVTAQPDTAIVSVSVVTQNRSAIEAQQQNATETTAVINALKKAAGNAAEIKTSSYSLVPQRVYKENQPPTITGYEVRNSILVTMSDLSKVGAVIDAATRAGANNVDGVSFILRRDTDAGGRALEQAAREAIGKANLLAQALGGRVVRIVTVEEIGKNPRPVIYAQREALMAQTAETPIEVGTLEINSQVQLVAEVQKNEK